MGKHSKNNNDRAFFSHAERRAALSGRHASSLLGNNNFHDWGWGTEGRTLDSDSMKDIDACSLSLQPCSQPLLTPAGVLYDKQVVIEYILSRKKEIEAETAAWEAQQASDEASAKKAEAAAYGSRIAEFVAQQEGLSQADIRARLPSDRAAAGASSSASGVTTAATMGRALVTDQGTHAADTNFWVVTNTPEARTRVERPDQVVRCPITSEPLRLKAMVPVIFSPADDDDDAAALVAKKSSER